MIYIQSCSNHMIGNKTRPPANTDIFRPTTNIFQRMSGIEILFTRGVYHDFLSKFFVSVAKIFLGEPFCVSKIFWYRKILWIRRGREGVSQFSIENLLSHSTEKHRRRTLLCFRKFLVSKNFMDKRG